MVRQRVVSIKKSVALMLLCSVLTSNRGYSRRVLDLLAYIAKVDGQA